MKPSPFMRRLLRAPVSLYRWRCGWLLGHRFLLLIHVGRRTGRLYETVLEVMEYRKPTREALVMSGFGRDADWLRNIEATPYPQVIISRDRFRAVHRILPTEEAVEVVESYERRTQFIAPVVRVVLRRLLGWSYGGSTSDRRRLVTQLPLIAFRPAP